MRFLDAPFGKVFFTISVRAPVCRDGCRVGAHGNVWRRRRMRGRDLALVVDSGWVWWGGRIIWRAEMRRTKAAQLAHGACLGIDCVLWSEL